MDDSPAQSVRQYRRRILGWGILALVVVFAVGSLVAVSAVQDDLEERSAEALVAVPAADDVVDVEFSGQDGTVLCSTGLAAADVAVVRDQLLDVRGVSDIVFDSSCLTGPAVEPEVTPDDDPAAPTPSPVTTTRPDVTDPPGSTAPDAPVEDATLAEVLDSDAQFSTLVSLISSAGLDDVLTADDPTTVLAPTNDAFQQLGADVIAALNRNPAVLSQVLRSHMIPGRVGAGELVGTVETGGEAILVEDGSIALAGVIVPADDRATIVEPDLTASNGLVHVIDRVLVDPDLDVADPDPIVVLTFVDGGWALAGATADAGQRQVLLAAADAASALGAGSVDDRLVIDPNSPLTVDGTGRAVQLINAATVNLTTATIDVFVDGAHVTGTYLDDDALEAFRTAVAEVAGGGVTVDLTAVPAPSEAEVLAADLNGFVADNPVTFEPASAVITAASAAALDQIATRLGRSPGIPVEVRGHTDTDGDPEFNQELSEARAQAVVAALVGRGVPEARLTASGRGGSEPILGPDGSEDKPASRRVEFVVAPSGQ